MSLSSALPSRMRSHSLSQISPTCRPIHTSTDGGGVRQHPRAHAHAHAHVRKMKVFGSNTAHETCFKTRPECVAFDADAYAKLAAECLRKKQPIYSIVPSPPHNRSRIYTKKAAECCVQFSAKKWVGLCSSQFSARHRAPRQARCIHSSSSGIPLVFLYGACHSLFSLSAAIPSKCAQTQTKSARAEAKAPHAHPHPHTKVRKCTPIHRWARQTTRAK